MTDGDDGSVRLVGTAHVSQDSADTVRSVIEAERPDVVAVELDEGRYRQLRGETPEDLDARDLLRGSVAFQLLAYWLLSYVQARLGERFDVEPGADMRAAIEAAEATGAGLALVDRDIQVTIQRFWARLSMGAKLQLLGGLAFGVTGAPVAGVTGGLLVGLVVGPIAGLLSGMAGVTTGQLATVLGATIVGAVVWYLVDGVVGDLAFSLAAGVVAGVIAGPVTGIVGPAVDAVLGDLALRLLGGIAASAILGTVLGGMVGVVAAGVTGRRAEPVEDIDLDDLTDSDVVTAMLEEFRRFSPGGAAALIDERDAYIAHRLVALRAAGLDVVAVVGAGHRDGVQAYLDDPGTLPPLSGLTGTESGGVPWGTVVGALLSLGALAFFGLLVMANVGEMTLVQVVGAWVLFNGVFAFGLAKLAGAHNLSALVGGSVAWLTSLNPLLAPGWFAGYIELRYLSVRISDISTLNEILADEETPVRRLVGQLLDVPLFRLIAVVALTNVGSFIASILFPVVVLPLIGGPFDSVAAVTAALERGIENTVKLFGGWPW